MPDLTRMNEYALLDTIEQQWGQHGAHADVMRSLIAQRDRLQHDLQHSERRRQALRDCLHQIIQKDASDEAL